MSTAHPELKVQTLAARIQRDPLFRVSHVDLGEAFEHVRARVDREMVDVSDCVAVQSALKKVIRAVAEAERQMDIRETENSIGWAKKSIRDSQASLKTQEKRLAELSEGVL